MGNFGGFANAKQKLDQAKAERAEKMAQNSTGYLRLESGVEKMLRTLCDFEKEPHIFKSHFVKRLNRSFVCSGEADCPGCEEKEAGDKGINLGQRAAISVWDYTILHKIPKKGKRDEYDFEICEQTEDNAECRWCERKIEAKMVGKRYWEMSMSCLETLLTVAGKLADQCVSCGHGKIKHVEWECAECGEVQEVGADEVRVKCSSKKCGFVGPPKEVISCTKCKKPVRATLNDCDISVIKSGENTATVHVITPERSFTDLDPRIFTKPEMSEPIDFEVVLAPPTPKVFAKALGTDFSNHNRGARGYSDDAPAHTDDDAPPARPARRGSPRDDGDGGDRPAGRSPRMGGGGRTRPPAGEAPAIGRGGRVPW